MRQYLDLLGEVLDTGDDRMDRTGVGTRSLFARQMRFDLQQGFPLLTTKKLHLPAIVHELLWFLRGDTNVRYLRENGVRIWDEWADEKGELGPIYGYQWRHWGGDQLADVIDQIRTQPYSRRHVVSAWNVGQLQQMALPPCHLLFQFYVSGDRLCCQMYQRSADLFLGVPFNIASYALLTMIVARLTKLRPGEFVHTFGDVHLYHNHFAQARLQMQRSPKALPEMEIVSEAQSLEGFCFEDFRLHNYDPAERIPAPVAV